MRRIFVLLFLSICFGALAQSPDMPDYRTKRENFSKITDKNIQNDLAVFTMSAIDMSVGKLPLKGLPVTDFGENFIQFDSDNIKVIIRAGEFEPDKHKLQYNGKYLVRIDNKPYYGSYGAVPERTIASVTLLVHGDTIPIPPAAIADLYEPSFTYLQNGKRKSYNGVYFSNDKRNIYIYMLNNDGVGGYEVTWVIQDKKYLRRVVDFGFLKSL